MRGRFVLLLLDLAIVAATTVLAFLLREPATVSLAGLGNLLTYLVASVLVAAAIFPLFGLNRTIWRLSGPLDYITIVMAVGTLLAVMLPLGFVINRLEGVPRSLPIIQGLLLIFAMVGARVAARHFRRDGTHALSDAPVECKIDTREVAVIIGFDQMAQLFLEYLSKRHGERFIFAGLIGRSDRHTGRLAHGLKVLGKPEDIASIIANLAVHGMQVKRIFVTTEFKSLSEEARQVLLNLEAASHIKVDLVADSMTEMVLAGVRTDRPRLHTGQTDEMTGRRVATYALAGDQFNGLMLRPYWRIKRLMDIAVAAVLILLLTPIMMVVLAVVIIDVGSPVAFWQQRPGLNGRMFKLFKLRTMASAIGPDGERIPDADRVSRIGNFLRRTRLDEFPQLFNILLGEMSLVGPRPLLPVDQPLCGFTPRLLVRPGITGWAQVKGGRIVSAADKTALDVYYILNASLFFDLRIMLETVRMVVLGERVDTAAIAEAWKALDAAGISIARDDAGGRVEDAQADPSTIRNGDDRGGAINETERSSLRLPPSAA